MYLLSRVPWDRLLLVFVVSDAPYFIIDEFVFVKTVDN